MKRFFQCLTLAILSACGGAPEIVEQKPMDEMYASAYEKIGDENYAEAARIFLDIETTYPTSRWSTDALIMAAYSQYRATDFAGAVSTIDRFMRFHPGHADVGYMMYLNGMCFYRQVSDVRREPGMSAYALNAFNRLRQRFPKSEYAENAKNKIAILKNYIAGKVMYSARRDLAGQNYPVAISNLQKLVLSMPETLMIPEALYRLAEAYRAIGLTGQAAGYGEMLKTNFPDDVWAKKLE
jgi:outer membrane protein assembly factor BamD